MPSVTSNYNLNNIIDKYSVQINHKHKKENVKKHPASSDSLYVAKLHTVTKKPILVIVNDTYSVNRMITELGYFAQDKKIAIFPDTEVLPYERVTPIPHVIANRLLTLSQISNHQVDIVITNINTIQTRLCPVSYLASRMLVLHIGDKLSIAKLKSQLIDNDYNMVDKVYEAGEFRVTGGVIDIIPMGFKELIRIELFDDEIESLRYIDINSGTSYANVEKVEIIPAREYPTTPDGIKKFRENFKLKFMRDNHTNTTREMNALPAGSEFYLPLFFDNTASIFDYIDNTWNVVYFEHAHDTLSHNWQEINRRYNLFSYQYPCLPPNDVFIPVSEIFQKINLFNPFEIAETGDIAPQIKHIPDIKVDNKTDAPFKKFEDFLNNFKGVVYLVVNSIGRMETLKNTLNKYMDLRKYPQLHLVNAIIYHGFICGDVAIIVEDNLYYNQLQKTADFIKIRKQNASNQSFECDAIIRNIAEISPNDFVVHINHGIGKYFGISTQKIADIEHDMIEIEYQDNAKLFVPIQNLNLISKYNTISEAQTTATKLGSAAWNKTKQKIEKRVDDIASELLELYAKREMIEGDVFTIPPEYEDFANQFGYTPTTDQEKAFNDIIKDLTNKKPMDRLICGDVGFGKTEVAMRAAFICAMNGKQVAILTPTTLLATQHYQNFVNRFVGFPIQIEEVSRFKSKKDIDATLGLLKDGRVDILIGTHRLIQPDVKFKNLGLVIIDEEHRFGVKQKEKMRSIKTHVDILTMTATPIPRTLSMALDGIRDFSIIATPPQKRLPINTIVCNEDNEIIKDAIMREMRRGGQVFFLHNEVASIHIVHEKLLSIMPELQIGVAHGQMKETHLEDVIRDFILQKYNLLLCSTIIETGMDIPNANTIFIHRADKLGLAQLHQIRGRVGRSHHQAYCYLVVPDNISRDAAKRLDAITNTSELGGGFNLAIHDLEIRGAGEILGDKQSGDIKDVGMSLYTKMLKNAINKLKTNNINVNDVGTISCEVDLNVTSIIPHEYCGLIHERLSYYHRLSKAYTRDEIDLIYQDIINEHGLPTDAVKNLINSYYLKVQTIGLDILRMDIDSKRIKLTFKDQPKISPSEIISLMQKLKTCKIQQNTLTWQVNMPTMDDKIKQTEYVLGEIRQCG